MASTLRQNLLVFLNIRPGEGRLVGLVLLYAILLFTVNVLTRTASYALFLAEFGAASLPYTYIGVAVFATLISSIFLKVNERFSLARGLIGVHVFLLVTLVAYWLGLFTAAPVVEGVGALTIPAGASDCMPRFGCARGGGS